MKKVYVCCPGGAVTGGPELLHQFVDALRENNVDAYILYCPLKDNFFTPEVYKCYNAPSVNYSEIDFDNAVIVIPEIFTGLIKHFPSSKIVVWWLSVDFYFDYTGNNPLKELLKDKIKYLLGRKKSIKSMRSHQHFVQSEYARRFLEEKGIKSSLLTDYLGPAHLADDDKSEISIQRENIIAYNPKKGIIFTNYLMSKSDDCKFIPIKNMTPQQVKELLKRAKVYMDFGNHPGKDRFPREAAMAGCCVITGCRGSAANNIDIPIPEKYKLNEKEKDTVVKFHNLISFIFNNFDDAVDDFSEYQNIVKREPILFKDQVKNFINEVLL